MSATKPFIPFNASMVPLEGSNLIEASAGTGKTYSIAILVLRLVLEKQVSIREILMVTFTKAAVAELEERIRLFIREACKASLGSETGDRAIMDLVKEAMRTTGAQETRELLKQAVLFLDETAVLTIHGFCQQTLAEFSFETRQLFGAETMQDTSTIIEQEVNRFWRKYITSVPADILEKLLENGLTRKNITDMVREHIKGKKFVQFEESCSYTVSAQHHAQWAVMLDDLGKKVAEAAEGVYRHVRDNVTHYTKVCLENANAKRHVLPLIGTPDKFVDKIVNSRSSKYIQTLFGDILAQWDAGAEIEKQHRDALNSIASQLICLAISEVTGGMEEFKLRNNLVSFDDMIVRLHTAVVERNNPGLIAALRKKYRAVFIDEFQDTDRLQYEIFQKVFGEEMILFYIGDPKQSIYAWRKADIFTYFKAGEAVDSKYGMNTNYRSSEKYIAAMNLFFKPVPAFDTFHFNGADQAIEYIHVESPEKNSKGHLYRKGEVAVPMVIYNEKNNRNVVSAVVAQVIELLQTEDYTIGNQGVQRKITPADIGIMVRKNRQGGDIKRMLSLYGIPAVTIDDAKIFTSEEATSLLYVLEAMADPSPAAINRALLSNLTGFGIQDILRLNDEQAITLFRKYKATWDADNVYTALMDFVSDYGVRQTLLYGNVKNGERIITNLFQLIELLHKVQASKKLSPLELTGWLKRGIEGMEMEGDEFVQRVESDEEAVRIVTIHKSKGLEYNIVLAPFMDFADEPKDMTICSFRHPESGDYVVMEKDHLSPEQKIWASQQAEQENRRLVYVAVTRAVYGCFIFQNTFFKNTLSVFVNALQQVPANSLVRFSDSPVVPAGYTRFRPKKWKPAVYKKAPGFTLLQENWARMSYTMLAAKHEAAAKPRAGFHAGRYDQFVFNQLARGSKTGNLLHFIFENAHFSDNSQWAFIMEEAVRRFVPKRGEDYLPMLQELLQQVLQSPIRIRGTEFCLAEILHDNRIHEFEFDFPVSRFKPSALNRLSDSRMLVSVKNITELEGVMNGKMDLIFEHRGKYYILDWKSNFLGDSLEDYNHARLAEAMNENNYHLQYLIYTLAAKKYLQSRLPGFDYEKDFGGVIYFFVRGVRSGSGNGIFTCLPERSRIEQLQSIISNG